MPGHSIHDNILITHEIMHKFKNLKGKATWVALKLDIEKTYDRLEWDFIEECLYRLGFHEIWIKWIIECITTVFYSLVINDEPTGHLRPSRGIRQGDPLLPYIFIMCMEVFSTALINAAQKPRTGLGIKLTTGGERIPCLLFAEDYLLFCRADQTNCSKLKHLLDEFCIQSGQLINFHKYTLTFS